MIRATPEGVALGPGGLDGPKVGAHRGAFLVPVKVAALKLPLTHDDRGVDVAGPELILHFGGRRGSGLSIE